jgi:hypothetical protein
MLTMGNNLKAGSYALNILPVGSYSFSDPSFTGSAEQSARAFSVARLRHEGRDVVLWLHRMWDDGSITDCCARHYCCPDRRGKLVTSTIVDLRKQSTKRQHLE